MSIQKLNGGYSYVTIYKIPKDEISKVDIAQCKQPRETLSSYYNRQAVKPDILTNGGFFGMNNGYPCFNMMDEGVKHSVNTNLKAGMGVDKTGMISAGSIDNPNYKDFLSGYPVLISNGSKVNITYAKEINYKAPRTIIGTNKDYVFIGTIDGRKTNKPGMTFSQMQTLCLKLGMTDAINLDGGGSTRMLYNGSVANSPTENRAVDNVVAIYFKKNTTPAPVTPPSTNTTDSNYTVKKGDSLYSIAEKCMGNGMKYPQLAAYNNINANSTIYAGQVLKIPGGTVTNPTKPTYTTYSVVKGDSLSKIALKKLGNANRYPEIMSLNNLTKTTIYVGQVLKIPN